MLKQEFIKMVTNTAFYAAIFSIVIILLLGVAYTSPLTGEEFTVLDFIISDNQNELLEASDLRESDLIARGIESYLDMFLPIIAVIPFVAVVCGEKKNNNTRFEIYRVGKTRYVAGKYMAAMITGGCITVTGFLLFCLLILPVFPDGVRETVEIQNEFLIQETVITGRLFKTFGIAGIYIMKFIRMFLYGAFVTVPALGLSVIIKNRYMILSIPFMGFYLLRKVIEKRVDADLYYFLPDMIGNAYVTEWVRLLVIYGSVSIMVFLWYRIYMGRKCDCGED